MVDLSIVMWLFTRGYIPIVASEIPIFPEYSHDIPIITPIIIDLPIKNGDFP